MKMDFEVIISKFKNRFKAICPDFPDCIGEGDSEEEAMEDLGNVITLHLGDTVRRTMDDVKQLGLLRRVSEVDNDQGKPLKKSLSFKKDPLTKEGKIMFAGKLPIQQEWLKKIDKSHKGSKVKKILGIGSVSGLGSSAMFNPLLDELQSPFTTELMDEGLLFGVPLSLN
ncbi:type II toxin-antitoxin system HicB family antitoxin [Candidatus Margulisiibacteriota bacterium]